MGGEGVVAESAHEEREECVVRLASLDGKFSGHVSLSECQNQSPVLAKMFGNQWSREASSRKVVLGPWIDGGTLELVVGFLQNHGDFDELKEELSVPQLLALLGAGDFLDIQVLVNACIPRVAVHLDRVKNWGLLPEIIIKEIISHSDCTPQGLLSAEKCRAALVSKEDLRQAVAHAWSCDGRNRREAVEARMATLLARSTVDCNKSCKSEDFQIPRMLLEGIEQYRKDVFKLRVNNRRLVASESALQFVFTQLVSLRCLDLSGNQINTRILTGILRLLGSVNRSSFQAPIPPHKGSSRPYFSTASPKHKRLYSSTGGHGHTVSTVAASLTQKLELNLANTGISGKGVNAITSFVSGLDVRSTKMNRIRSHGNNNNESISHSGRACTTERPHESPCDSKKKQVISLLQSLSTLNLRDNPIGDVGSQILADGLSNARIQIDSLDLSQNDKIGASGLQSLMLAIAACKFEPRVIRIGSCNCDLNMVLETLYPHLPRSAAVGRLERPYYKLETLDLCNNSFPLSCRAVSQSVDHPGFGCLRELNISGNPCSDATLEALMTAGSMPSMTSLSMANIGMSPQVAKRVSTALLGCPELRKLDVSRNALAYKGTACFAMLVSHHPRLAHLDISSNSFDVFVAGAFGAAFSKHVGSLETLNMAVPDWQQRIRTQGCAALCRGLLAVSHSPLYLKVLDLCGHAIKNQGSIVLANVIDHKVLDMLRVLLLRDNDISDAGAARLVQAFECRHKRQHSTGHDQTQIILDLCANPILKDPVSHENMSKSLLKCFWSLK